MRGGYCRLQMPLKLALGVRETVAGRRLGALEGGGGLPAPPFRFIPGEMVGEGGNGNENGSNLVGKGGGGGGNRPPEDLWDRSPADWVADPA